jgi:type I restriction enzyme, R subunit
MPSPEDKARENIDRLLTQAGWAVRDQSDANILAYRGVAIRNFTLKPGHGFADYLLYVDGRAAGVIEAKKEGVTLTGVETQSENTQKACPMGCLHGTVPFLFLTNRPASKPASPTA